MNAEIVFREGERAMLMVSADGLTWEHLDDEMLVAAIRTVMQHPRAFPKAAWALGIEAGPRAKRRVTRDVLEQVAEVYRANIQGSPTAAVRERFHVSVRQASNYVRLARDADLLPQTTQGRKSA